MKLFNKIIKLFHKQSLSDQWTTSFDSSFANEKWPFTDNDSMNYDYNDSQVKERESNKSRKKSYTVLSRCQVLETDHSEGSPFGRIDELLDATDNEMGVDAPASPVNASLKNIYSKIFKADKALQKISPTVTKTQMDSMTQTKNEAEKLELESIVIIKPERWSSSTENSNPFDYYSQAVQSDTSLGSQEVLSFISEENLENFRVEKARKFKTLCTDGSVRTWERTGIFPIINTNNK